MAEPLSPAAQAVLNAAYALPLRNGQPSLAAAICAAADQVVPDAPWPVSMMGPVYVAEAKKQRSIRQRLFAIAAELEGGATTTTTPQEAQ